MKTSKPSVKYQGISVPITLIDEIKKFIDDNPEYRSISELVKEAIREKIQQHNTKYKNMDFKEIVGTVNEVTKSLKEFENKLKKIDINPKDIQKIVLENQIIKKNNKKKKS